MSNQDISSGLRTGWIPDDQIAKARERTTRAQRYERQKGIGPPWTKDGNTVLYSVEGYRKWLDANAKGYREWLDANERSPGSQKVEGYRKWSVASDRRLARGRKRVLEPA
jgi:hypothetical protein